MDRVRYSRQLLVREWGVEAQERLHGASVLVIGAGGLGCSVILHLAAGGVGALGIVDFDRVERTNLHRQVLYGDADVGRFKAERACEMARARNPALRCDAYVERFAGDGGLALIVSGGCGGGYDVVVDCSDNVATRYAVSDACVLAGRALVSAAAAGVDGQLTVLNAPPPPRGDGADEGGEAAARGPCYRCLHPVPPAANAGAGRCDDIGVLGIVPGLIGCMQALEVLKLVGGVGVHLGGRLCVVDALYGSYRTVGPVQRRPGCIACGDAATRSAAERAVEPQLTNMARSVAWAERRRLGVCLNDELPARRADVHATAALPVECVVTCRALAARLAEGTPASSADVEVGAGASRAHILLLDVRSPAQFAICALPGAVNIPLAQLASRVDEVRTAAPAPEAAAPAREVFTLCRRGIDSIRAARVLLNAGVSNVRHVEGGLAEWARSVDPGFSMY
jgi:adenylyltransferase/sulfurtransferase